MHLLELVAKMTVVPDWRTMPLSPKSCDKMKFAVGVSNALNMSSRTINEDCEYTERARA